MHRGGQIFDPASEWRGGDDRKNVFCEVYIPSIRYDFSIKLMLLSGHHDLAGSQSRL
jgi:hypothetical protein